MERTTKILTVWAMAGALFVPASFAMAQTTATPPRPPGSSTEPPAVVPPASGVTTPEAQTPSPTNDRRYHDPQSGAQGDGQTGGPQSTAEPSKGTSPPPIAPPEASGKN